MAMKTPASILREISRIQVMERGKLCAMRTGPSGTYYNHQTWSKGRNIVRYVSPDQVEGVRNAIEGYQRFVKLTQAYADIIIRQSRKMDKQKTKKKRAIPTKSKN
jgi:hypothetical protein